MSDEKAAKPPKASHYVWTGGPLGGATLFLGRDQCYHAGAVLAGDALAGALASQPAYVEQRPGKAEPSEPGPANR